MTIAIDQTMSLQAVLAGAVTTQPHVHVFYKAHNDAGDVSFPAPNRVALNGTNDVTILSAPSGRLLVYEVTGIALYNADTASTTPTLKTDDGTTEYTILRYANLASLKSLIYEEGAGWTVP